MTDEQRLLLIQAAPGMRAREAVLLGIPNRSSVEENELHMIRREMARLEGRDKLPSHLVRTNAPARPAGFMAPMAVRPWMIWTGAVVLLLGALGIQTGRIESAKADLREVRAENRQLETEIMEANAIAQHFRDQAAMADELSRTTAANLEAERARNRVRADQERRRQREIRQVDAGGPPPDWERSLRDDAAGTPAAGGGNGSGDPG